MPILRTHRGQQLSEYAILLGVMATAFVGTQMYVSRRIAGVLITKSHDILGTMQPSDEGTNDSDSSDQLRQQGRANNVHTESVSHSSGSNAAGHFRFAEAYGPYLFSAFDANNPSELQVLSELTDSVSGGYKLAGAPSVSADGTVTAVVKGSQRGRSWSRTAWGARRPVERRISYKVVRLRFDRRNGMWWAQLDTNGDGKIDTYLRGAPEKQDLIARLRAQTALTVTRTNRLKDVITIDERDKSFSLPEDERIAIEQGIAADDSITTRVSQGGDLNSLSLDELKDLEEFVIAQAPTVDRAVDAVNRIVTADHKMAEGQRNDLLSKLHWGADHGKQLVSKDDVTWDHIIEMSQARSAMAQLVGDGTSLANGHELSAHLQDAADLLDNFDSSMLRDEDTQSREFKTAASELDQAYAMLEDDVNVAYGLTSDTEQSQPQTSRTVSSLILPYFQPQPGGSQSSEGDGAQLDVAVWGAGDRLPELAKVNGEYQNVVWHLVAPEDFLTDDGSGGVASAISLDLVSGMVHSETPQVTTIQPAPIPGELIRAAGMHPDDLKDMEAWRPLTPAAEEAATQAGAGQGTGQPGAPVTRYQPLNLGSPAEGASSPPTRPPVTGPGTTITTTVSPQGNTGVQPQ